MTFVVIVVVSLLAALLINGSALLDAGIVAFELDAGV
jgi:hypothetical protein